MLKFRTLAAVGWYVSLGGGGRINHILGNVTFSPAIPCAILGDAAEAVGELIRLYINNAGKNSQPKDKPLPLYRARLVHGPQVW